MRNLLVFFLTVVLVTPAVAQDVQFKASADKPVASLSDQIAFTITISGSGQQLPQPQLPDLSSFTVFSSGQSQNFSFVNGVMHTEVSYTYVLLPKSEGRFTIGPAEITIGGRTYRTAPVTIEVSQKAVSPPAGGGQHDRYTREQVQSGLADLFLKAAVDKKAPYVGEQVTLSLKFYQAVRLFDQPQYQAPALTGFWQEPLGNWTRSSEVVNGKHYAVHEMKIALFPTQPGRQTVGSASIQCTVEDLERFFSRDPFDQFGADLRSFFNQGQTKILRTDPITLEVRPLPEAGKPGSFSGAVGNFTLQGACDRTSVPVGQPVTLKMTISGTGNLKAIAEPKLPELSDFRTYASGSSEKIEHAGNRIAGTKTFEEVLIPKAPGKFQVPAITLSFFDPARGKYQTVKAGPFVITATGSAEQIASLPASGEGTPVVASDLRYLKTNADHLSGSAQPVIFRLWFWGLQLVPLLGLGGLVAYQKHQWKLATDVGYARSRRAHRMAKKRLATALDLIGINGQKEFFAEVSKAVLLYVADKFNTSTYGMTTPEMEDFLKTKGVSPELVKRLTELLTSCDLAKFAPTYVTQTDMKKKLDEAEEMIVSLEGVRR